MNPNAKILLATLEYPPAHGGVARYLDGLVHALPVATTILVHGPRKESEGIVQTPLMFSKLWPRWIKAIGPLMRQLKKTKPDFLLISHVLPMGYAALLARFFSGSKAKLIVICHGFDIARPLHSSPWKRFWIRSILKRAGLVVTNSNFTKGMVATYGIPEEKICVVYPGIDQQEIPKNSIAKGQPILLSIGRLVARKGFDCMIMALPKIVQEVPNIKYIIAGDGPDRQRLKKLAFSIGMDRFVWFTGAIDDTRKHKLLSTSHVFAMPSRDIAGDVEGFGIVFLEAARYGLPAIGSHSGGIPEAIEDTLSGVLVDPMSTDEIAHTIGTLFNTPGLIDQMGDYARNRVNELFTWEVTVRPIIEKLEVI